MLPTSRIICADVIDGLRQLEPESMQCVVTSPPYWGLRDYGVEGQFGLEKTPEEFIEKMVAIFQEVRRVLRDDGTVWLNLGDSYASSRLDGSHGGWNGSSGYDTRPFKNSGDGQKRLAGCGLKPKDLCGIPWRCALALQAAGWWLRSDIIWSKPNPMPESVTDRPTRSHEYVFLLTKKARYYYDADAIREGSDVYVRKAGGYQGRVPLDGGPRRAIYDENCTFAKRDVTTVGRNKRTVWEIPTQAYSEAHFATFPEKLVEPCILAGTSAKGCCPECGKGWERVVEKTRENKSYWGKQGKTPQDVSCLGKYGGKHQDGSEYYDRKRKDYDVRLGPTVKTQTLGWQPGCECTVNYETLDKMSGEHHYPAAYKPVPVIVLDPFCGSGTTGLVALKHKRSFIGIELNPEYVKLAEDRIGKAVTGVPAKEAKAGQLALFGGE